MVISEDRTRFVLEPVMHIPTFPFIPEEPKFEEEPKLQEHPKFQEDPKGLDFTLVGEVDLRPKASAVPQRKTGPPAADDFDFWRFRDLKDRNIVSDRADLF